MEVASLYREPPREQERATAAVEFHDVFKIYRSGPAETVALRGLDLRIEAGEFLEVVSRTPAELDALVASGEVTDAKAIKALGDRTVMGKVVVTVES